MGSRAIMLARAPVFIHGLVRGLACALVGVLGIMPAHAKEACASVDAAGVAGWFDQWNLTLASLSADQVVQRYWPDAVLLPTFSNTPRTNPGMIREYFTHFLEQHPRGRIDTRTMQLGCNMAVDMGTYTFALMDEHGRTSEAAGRYTFIYQYRGGAWKILHHHSSAMPEALAKASQGAAKPGKAGKKSGAAAAALAKPAGSHGSFDKAQGTAQGTPESKVAVIGGSQPFLNADNSPNVAQFYPPDARARGEQGAVAMRVCTGATGEINQTPEILESSGSEDLDDAAKQWANAAHWIPATRQNATVEGCTRVRIEFRMG